MLSYRHSFHAGNFADIVKHIVLVEILNHLKKKETPFEYIDTHSGTGLYNLGAPDSQKLQEYAGGIGKLNFSDFPELELYFQVIKSFNESEKIKFYPGSPSIARYFLRPQDRGWLFELHPADYKLLHDNFARCKNVRVGQQDGFKGLMALVPPKSRRGLVLIDPSYEIKSEYRQVIDSVVKAHKKFAYGIYAIWYPVVERQTIQKMEKRLLHSGIKNIQRFELGIAEDSSQYGMTSSGVFVINPPWTLFDKMARLLPNLSRYLTDSDKPLFKCDILVSE